MPISKFLEFRSFLIKHDGSFSNLPKSWNGAIDPVKRTVRKFKPNVIVEKYKLDNVPDRFFESPGNIS